MPSRYAGTYTFKCARELRTILDLLNEAGPWMWCLRDSDEHGPYLLARPDDSHTKVRLVGEEPPEYQLVTSYDPGGTETPISLEHLHDTILDRLFPSIGAIDVKAGPSFDW